MEMTLSNGLKNFWQWDAGQSVTVPDNVPSVDFKINDETAVRVTVSNNTASVPDECFQSGEDLILWAYKTDHTIDAARVKVRPRVKPQNYVYTETEKAKWHELDERMTQIEENSENVASWGTAAQTGLSEMKKVRNSLNYGEWTPVVSGAASYDYREGTYVRIGNMMVIAFEAYGEFTSTSNEALTVTGCPAAPPAQFASGGGNLSGYYAADNLVFSGWNIGTDGTITPQCQWATEAGTKWTTTPKTSANAPFSMSGTIAFRVEE